MSLIPMNTEQLRREGIKNAQQKLQEQKNFQAKVEQMSKHNVGGLYDIRAIKNSKQLKEQCYQITNYDLKPKARSRLWLCIRSRIIWKTLG